MRLSYMGNRQLQSLRETLEPGLFTALGRESLATLGTVAAAPMCPAVQTIAISERTFASTKFKRRSVAMKVAHDAQSENSPGAGTSGLLDQDNRGDRRGHAR